MASKQKSPAFRPRPLTTSHVADHINDHDPDHVDVYEGAIAGTFLLAPHARRAPSRPASAPPAAATRSAGARAFPEVRVQGRRASEALAFLSHRRAPVRPRLLEVRRPPHEGSQGVAPR